MLQPIAFELFLLLVEERLKADWRDADEKARSLLNVRGYDRAVEKGILGGEEDRQDGDDAYGQDNGFPYPDDPSPYSV